MRPYPLIDEIKMHLHIWEADDTWKQLPIGVRDALTTVLNEIRTRDTMKTLGMEDGDNKEFDASKEKKVFIAAYCDKWREYCGFENTEKFKSEINAILRLFCQKLHSEGATSLDYLDWFFDDFLKKENNKKYWGSPPRISGVISNNVFTTFLYEKKQTLNARKQDMANLTVKSAVLELANNYLLLTRNKDFGKKILEYTGGTLSLSQFCSIFLALLEKNKETELIEKMKGLMGNGQV